jgi:hypothetical protein
MHYLESILRVLLVGLVLGAGLPAVFAVGLRAYSSGTAALKPVGLLLFGFVAAVIVLAILWITRGTIIHHFGVDLFPYLPRKK